MGDQPGEQQQHESIIERVRRHERVQAAYATTISEAINALEYYNHRLMKDVAESKAVLEADSSWCPWTSFKRRLRKHIKIVEAECDLVQRRISIERFVLATITNRGIVEC